MCKGIYRVFQISRIGNICGLDGWIGLDMGDPGGSNIYIYIQHHTIQFLNCIIIFIMCESDSRYHQPEWIAAGWPGWLAGWLGDLLAWTACLPTAVRS